MTVKHTHISTAISIILLFITGCMSRAIREGVGVVRGASGKVVPVEGHSDFSAYRSVEIDSIRVSDGLRTPSNLTSLVREAYLDTARELDLSTTARPSMTLKGTVIHYESDDVIEKAIGPLQEIIVHTELYDTETSELIARAHLIGRAKSTTSSGEKNLAEGAGKALKKWLERDDD